MAQGQAPKTPILESKFWLFSFLVALTVEAKALCILGKHATPELHYQPLLFIERKVALFPR